MTHFKIEILVAFPGSPTLTQVRELAESFVSEDCLPRACYHGAALYLSKVEKDDIPSRVLRAAEDTGVPPRSAS